MLIRPIICKSSPWFKWAILLTSWILSISILIIFSANSELNTLYSKVTDVGPEFKLPKNQIGTVRYMRRDPNQNSRPIHSFSFENLLTESNKIGIFKTGLHKVVRIRDLQLTFFQYSQNHSSQILSNPFIVSQDLISNIKGLISQLKWITNEKSVWHVKIDIDLGNVSEVLVNGFDYQVFYDGNLFLGIQSKRAIASYKQSGLELRGHVIISAADGSTLECNYAKWDTQTEHFKINGIYVLNRNGIKTIGKDISVDGQLNLAGAQQAKSKPKEIEKCFAGLQ